MIDKENKVFVRKTPCWQFNYENKSDGNKKYDVL